jgi:hypothetical protein
MPEGTEGQPPEGNQPPADAPEKTFKQTDVDTIVEQRLARERTKFADYDALKQKAAAFDQAEAAKQTELEKAQAAAAAAAEREQSVIARANSTLKRAAIMAEAATQKSVDPEMVAMLLANNEGIAVKDDGSVDGVKAAVTKLLKDKTFLAAGTSGSSSSGAEFNGNDDTQGLEARIAEAERKGDYTTAMALKMQRAGAFPG